MKFEYKTDPKQDDLAPGETELDETEIHRIVEERDDEVITVREDDNSDQLYAWPAPIEENSGLKIIESNQP